jgi:exodeoxyribonuclease V gamma subunit
MGISLIRSNRMDALQQLLAEQCKQHPLPSPLMAETVIVPNPALERWLGLALASSLGINANHDFVSPSSWSWTLLRTLLPTAPRFDPLSRERMSWLIFDALPQLLNAPAFVDLHGYLDDDSDGRKRWQLSSRIAQVFERYQHYRPDWIRQWTAAPSDHWQGQLWRALLAEVGADQHRVALLDRCLAHINEGHVPPLPPRVTLFAPNALPPLLITLLDALSQHMDVRIFLYTPNRHDVAREQALQRLRQHNDQSTHYYEARHELLSSWAQQGQAFEDLLLAGQQPEEHSIWHEPSAPTILGYVQHDLFHDAANTQRAMTVDDSLQVHICHSPMREVQVLHDQLLAMLEQDATLRAEDVMVMIPEISLYAPYIEAVFGESSQRPFIPWNISDVCLADDDPVIEAFFSLLALPQSRFTLSELTSFLDVAVMMEHHGLDAEQVDNLRPLLTALGARWGVDGEHRSALGLPNWSQQSWQAAMDRWLAGYALGEEDAWQGIAPVPVSNDDAHALAAFCLLLTRLNHWRQQLGKTYNGATWQRLLLAMLQELFGDKDDTQGKLSVIRQAIDDLSIRAHGIALSPALLRQYLTQELGRVERRARYFSGGITFCAMQAQRALPFRVIALLGMQDANFPRREKSCEFDDMAGTWQAGDPSTGGDDRYLMLETVLCAQQRLYISYCGRSIKDNSECQPSVLLRELLDALDQAELRPAGQAAISERITQQHSMQPFSPTNYSEDYCSYDSYWANVANNMAHTNPSDAPPPAMQLTGLNSDTLLLSTLASFVSHPIRYFFEQQLGLCITTEEVVSDDETFTPDGLQQWQLRQQLLESALSQEPLDSNRLRADALLAYGAWGDQQILVQQDKLSTACERLADYSQLQATPCPLSIACTLADGRIITVQAHPARYYPGKGLLHVTASSFGMRAALRLWLEHLAMCAAGVFLAGECSTLLCQDSCQQWQPLPAAEARELLIAFITALDLGMQQPLPIFPKASWAWINAKEEAREKAAKKAWYSGEFNRGDDEDPYIALYMRGQENNPLSIPDFEHWASLWFRAMLDARGKA